jgi:lipopolysaccharide transport system ATP-binding protein
MEKARARLEDMVRGAEILVLSSHMAKIVNDWCTRVIWMDQGRIVDDGTPAEVLLKYLGPDGYAAADIAPAVQTETSEATVAEASG